MYVAFSSILCGYFYIEKINIFFVSRIEIFERS